MIIIIGYIYIITNKFNNKVYIGQTKRTLNARLRAPKNMANNIKRCKYTQFLIDMHYNDISEYTITSLYTIETNDKEYLKNKLNTLEMETINNYKLNNYNLYNIAPGGCGGDVIHLMDEKTKLEINNKRSLSLIKYINDTKCRSGTKNGMFGKTHTEGVKKSLSEKASKRTGLKASNIKRYICLNNNNVYNGLKEISVFLNTSLEYTTYKRYIYCKNKENKKEFKIVNYNNEEYTFILLEKVLSI